LRFSAAFLDLHYFPGLFLLLFRLVRAQICIYVTMALLLSNLTPDAIFSIFAYCDISSVISASQTCRYLHDLAFDKSVWLVLLDNLRRRSILERTFDLEALSVAEMVGMVRRLIKGPQIWSSEDPDRDPVAKTITLHPQIPSDPGMPGLNSVKLLPSGRYVLLLNREALECWNVAHDRLVWRHTPAVEHTRVVAFEAEEIDTDSAIIMVCLRADLPDGPMGTIEMVNVDFRTGTHNCLLTARAPESEEIHYFYQAAICGELASVKYNSGYIIINWRAKSYFTIHCDDESHSRLALIPRHIVVLIFSAKAIPLIHLISNDTIRTYFSPTIGLDEATEFSGVSVEEIPKLHTFYAISTQPSFAVTGMQIQASPIRETDYRVWIWARNADKSALLFSYQLSIPVDRVPQSYLRTQTVSPGAQVSYSGHVLHYRGSLGGWIILSPNSSTAHMRHQVFPDSAFLQLTTYSGTMIFGVESTLVVQYYK
ncbi:hypothetical protein C8R45DRAFT_1178912, partial [Mycena sanguinolenta]